MQDDIDMEPLHKLFIYRKKLVKPYIERLLKWMDGITYMMSALFILTLVYEHGFLISFEEMEMINTLYHFVWIVFLVDISLHLLLNYSDTKRKYRGLACNADSLYRDTGIAYRSFLRHVYCRILHQRPHHAGRRALCRIGGG